jgi:hypothetical protein
MRGIALHEPCRHERARGTCSLQRNGDETVKGRRERFQDGFGARRAGCVDDEPSAHGIDPRTRGAALRQSPRTQFVGHLGFELAHLAPSHRISLFRRLVRRTLLSDLSND